MVYSIKNCYLNPKCQGIEKLQYWLTHFFVKLQKEKLPLRNKQLQQKIVLAERKCN